MIFQTIRTEDLGQDTPSPPPPIGDPPPPQPPPPPLNGLCGPYPIKAWAIPENVAQAWRDGNTIPFDNWLNLTAVGDFSSITGMDAPTISIMFNSPVPYQFPAYTFAICFLDGEGVPASVNYAGTQPQNPSVPGVVIDEPPPPPPVMPPPVEPPIIRECRQRITDDIQQPVDESGYILDRLKSQATGQIDYQLAQVEPALAKMTQKIDANIINTMSEVYSGAYQVGLGIPSTEQIMAGEPVYSPYGIGADQPIIDTRIPAYDPNLPYCDELTPTPTPTPTTGGPGPRPDYPTPTPTPTPTTPPPTNPPGVSCPAPVVQCPDPPDIVFRPNITVNIPKQDGTNVTVNVDSPTPTPSPTPTDSPSPSPTPTGDPPPDKPDIEVPSTDPNVYNDTDIRNGVIYQPNKYVLPSIQGGADWSSAAACAELDARGSTWDDRWFNKFLGMTTYENAGGLVKSIGEIKIIGPSISRGLWNFTNYIVEVIGAIPSSFLGGKFGKSAGPFLGLTIAGLGEKIGLPLTFLTKGLLYDLQYTNPQTIPGETEFTSLYLANGISADEFTCMIQANGSYPSWWQRIAQANRTRISNEQIIQLNRRNLIGPEAAFSMLRGNGVLNETDAKLMYTASEALPTVSDIVRFMVRDADDNEVAAKYGTDAALNTKYGAQLQSWAKGQGITDQVMKYYWRSHWEIPSNTALFEMLHRLRPQKTGQSAHGGISVSPDDIKDALVVNDVLPFWAERLMEISYKPLTRTDAQRAFFIDAIDENELTDSYLDLGYDDDNAARLVRFTIQLKNRRKQATGGTEKAMAVIKYYKNFLLTDSEATARLRNGGLSEKAAVDAMQIASKQRSNDSQLACIKGVHSKYKRFIYGDNDARKDLIAIGVPLENIDKLIANWNCERANKPKELSAAQVCKAYKQELIDKPEYIRRLNAIGYDVDDANVIFEICTRPPPLKPTTGGPGSLPKTQAQKDAQTAAARAVTQAALDQLASQPQLPTEPPIP